MDVSFKQENNLFRYRVAAVIIKDNKVLMHRVKGNTYWALPGGRCEYNETSIDAIKREMSEEISLREALDVRLLWVVENLYNKDDENIHEMSLYYNLDIRDDELICELETLEIEDGDKLIEFTWLDLDNIANESIKPDFLKNKLTNLGDKIEHFIEIE